MEFFERAHVVKSKNSQRKESKSEENVKKQLKQMLYGYQHSDNSLIKDSDKVKQDFEDSSSVSGYSDLNLTNTSNDGDVTKENERSNQEDHLVRNNLTSDGSLDSDNSEEDAADSLIVESISEYNEDLKTLSEDNTPEAVKYALQIGSETESDLSFIETSTDLDSSSYDESEFDVNGELAAKIMKKIDENKKDIKKTTKRKFDQLDTKEYENVSRFKYKGPYMPDDKDNDINSLSVEMSSINLPVNNQYAGPFRPRNQSTESTTERSTIQDDSLSQEDSSVHSKETSSPFVSVFATDIEDQSLADVLGEYRHPTIRNLPSGCQTNFATENSDLFRTENVSVIDIHTDEDDNEQKPEDLCSLIPEVDNNPVIEDFELNDTSMKSVEDSTSYEAIDTEETSEREASTDSIDPTLVNPVKVYYGKNNQCIFVLKHPVEIYIHGKVKLKALGGSIEILGYQLKDRQHEIYAPNYNYAQCLKTVKNQNAYYGLFGKLTATGLLVSEAEDIVTSIGEYDGVISMQPLRSRQMDFVENNFTTTDLFSKLSKNIENCFKEASEMLECSLYLSQPWKSFQENAVWKQVVNSGLVPDAQSRGLVCGGKGVGKSTFLRYYVNRLLSSGPVLVVDLDPGQPEFTVAGNLSATVVTEPLLGPNFTHLRTPEIMLNIGVINTMDSPKRYVAAVEALITHCLTDPRLQTLPWIVNTMGMTNSIGLKFISLIILQVQPTHLIQIDSKVVKKRYDFHLYPQTVKNLYFEDYQTDQMFCNIKEVNLDYAFFLSHHSDNAVKNNYSLAPKDERYLNFLAYFGRLLDERSGDLLSIVPYEVSLKDLKIGLNVKMNRAAITKVINGKIVALCQSPPDCGSVFTLADAPLKCFGVGLIRGIDWEKEVVYVLSSESPTRLSQADCLVYGDWAPELRGPALAALPDRTALPYRTASHYQQRQFMFAPKRRFNPLQLLKMSRSS